MYSFGRKAFHSVVQREYRRAIVAFGQDSISAGGQTGHLMLHSYRPRGRVAMYPNLSGSSERIKTDDFKIVRLNLSTMPSDSGCNAVVHLQNSQSLQAQ
ncbi:hypothetical protein AVEN_184214-1 [Araneus ventricosus]|uniref:Uncharacterized protein n=1 Tax=Araneus ventricosus TaxID=182803 RepID=A0A4Y2M3R0_ARAVE|nr:hypothetical protein AVEN_184214-1 [Araneus ventricosus]